MLNNKKKIPDIIVNGRIISYIQMADGISGFVFLKECIMDKKVTVDIIVSSLCTALGIKQTQLARMLKINDSSISSNMEKSVDEIRTKKTGKRLLPLFLVVSALEGGLINQEAMIEGLNEPTIPNMYEGRNESVLQAIQSGSLSNPAMLIEKAKEGVETYRAKKERANKRVLEAVEHAFYA